MNEGPVPATPFNFVRAAADIRAMPAHGQMSRAARAVAVLLAVALAAYVAELALPVMPAAAGDLFEKYVSNVVFLGAALLCAWRALAIERERLAWGLFAAGLALFGLGDLYFTLALWDREVIPIPSVADLGYLGLYPFFYAGVVSLFRSRVAPQGASLWADGLIAALSIAAFAATLLFGAIVSSTGGDPLTVATNLAYPLADLLLAGFVFGALAMTGWSLRNGWVWIAAGLLAFAATDAVYLYGTAVGSYDPGDIVDAGWPLAALVIGIAAWLPGPVAPVVESAQSRHWRTITLPLGFGLGCLTLLVYDHFSRVNVLVLGLAAAAMLAVLWRLGLTFADNVRMLTRSRGEALSDALTGLRNRRALTADLDRVLSGDTPHVLALFDLDGFKHYNDTFGHPAGDSLLARLGRSLAAHIERSGGSAYRIGGDEFCVLCPAAGGHEAIAAEAAFALTERGEGFAVGCSFGAILLPAEAQSAEQALQVVDQRMYADKHRGRASAGRQSTEVLRRALFERNPEHGHDLGDDVADLAGAVGRRLRMSEDEIESVLLAAELRNVGTVALPDAILAKPTMLDPAEREFVRRHPVVGERILAAAPSLAGVARLVRSSHERIDGLGYPDGLRGDEIPLGARIVFACDAYVAMCSDRRHVAAISSAAALAELTRNAGRQFDRDVVAAIGAEIASRVNRPGTAARPPA